MKDLVHGSDRARRHEWRVAGIVIEVTGVFLSRDADALFQKKFMDVNDPASGEDLLEVIVLELLEAGAASVECAVVAFAVLEAPAKT